MSKYSWAKTKREKTFNKFKFECLIIYLYHSKGECLNVCRSFRMVAKSIKVCVCAWRQTAKLFFFIIISDHWNPTFLTNEISEWEIFFLFLAPAKGSNPGGPYPYELLTLWSYSSCATQNHTYMYILYMFYYIHNSNLLFEIWGKNFFCRCQFMFFSDVALLRKIFVNLCLLRNV